VLCQEAWSAEYVPVTGSPAVRTATLLSFPLAAVTLIPCDGSAPVAGCPVALFPGVIVTTGPAGDGLTGAEDAARGADEAAATCFAKPDPADPVQAVTVRASTAPAATAEIVLRTALIAAPSQPLPNPGYVSLNVCN
jgi:hypothetical protein